MSLAVWFWILMLLALLFGGWGAFNKGDWHLGTSSLLWWLIMLVLGIGVFGGPIK